ncbi:MAG TPA: 7TM diverse intracellular signaling domain-containing protein, partial [Leptospiraceae bacterium]|nr:7TM diverse intracellular signaling domain-containing protein [Leptospiraceae bacterium]
TGFYAVRGYKIDSYGTLVNSREDRIGLVLISLYLFVGVYHLLLFWKRRQDRYNLFYALFAILLFVYLMTRHYTIFELPYDTRMIQRVELVVLYPLGPWLMLFFDYLFLNRARRLTWIFAAFNGLLSLITLFLPMHLAEVVLCIWQATVPILFVYGIFILAAAMRAKNRDAWRLLLGMVLFIVGAAFDILDSAKFHTGLTLTKYSFSIFVIGIAVILANRFMRVHNSVEELNEDRTRELSETLSTVQAMKTQQDGDYFLTSLLISPLNANRADSRIFGVETLISQKKKFKFKKWEAEIGGDIVTAHTIELAGRRYVAFLNGDAMGKSIQGAGGALVLGTVFKSLITRTQTSTLLQSRMPERWLKECFLELQNTFVSFDGTMLISAVVGLADEATGF